MSKVNRLPSVIRTMNFHGARLQEQDSGDQWFGYCVFCDDETRFFVNADSTKWDCKHCGLMGNDVNFLEKVAEKRHVEMTRKKWLKLSSLRGIPTGILRARRLGYCPINKTWLIPCYSAKGRVHDIRSWDTKVLRVTAGRKSQLFGANRLKDAPAGTRVWLCEGEWDTLAMDWLLREAKIKKDVVVSVPGANVFKKEWVSLFERKKVICVYDSDKAGDNGAMRVETMIKQTTSKLQFVCWPDTLPDGWDVRDFVTSAHDKAGGKKSEPREGWAKDAIEELLSLIKNSPRRAVGGAVTASKSELTAVDESRPLKSDMTFDELVTHFDKAILMTSDMQDALKVMMAVALSNDVRSDPLWVYLVGAPGAGKTLLLQSLQGSDRCVFRSTITPHGLVSGWSQGDPSLIPRLSGKCLVVKDFTEILGMPAVARDEVYSTLRGAFDGSVDKSFGNGVHRVYNRSSNPPFLGFSLLAGVTHAIHGHKEASLGERFVKFQLRELSPRDAQRVNLQALNSIGQERKREDNLQWAIASFLDKTVDIDRLPGFTQETAEELEAVVSFVAAVRTQDVRDRFTGELLYRPVPEAGTRLIKQFGQLARILALIDDAATVGPNQMRIVERVAQDTVSGFKLDIVDSIMRQGGKATRQQIAEDTRIPSSTLYRRLESLRDINILDRVKTEEKTRGRKANKWQVNPYVARLWKRAHKETTQCPSTPLSTENRKQVRVSVNSRNTSKRTPRSSKRRVKVARMRKRTR